MSTDSEWFATRLGDVATIDRRVVAPATIGEHASYVGLEHIADDGTISSRTVEPGELRSSKFAFSAQHVLYGKLRPYLCKIARPITPGICSTDILPILPGSNLDRNYFFHWLRQPRTVALATARSDGVNLPRISPTRLLDLPFLLPSLDEQRRVALMLDKAEAIQRNQAKRIRLVDEFVHSAFLEIFGDLTKNEPAWPTAKLRDLISAGPQNGLYRPASDYGSGTRIVRIDSFYDGELRDASSLKRVRLTSNEISVYGLRPGDILVNRVNSREFLGKSALVPVLDEPTVFESNIMRFEVDARQLNPCFSVAVFQTQYFKRQIRSRTRDAVNQASINQDDLKSFEIPVPPLQLQQRFERIHRQLTIVNQKLRDVSNQSDSLFVTMQRELFPLGGAA